MREGCPDSSSNSANIYPALTHVGTLLSTAGPTSWSILTVQPREPSTARPSVRSLPVLNKADTLLPYALVGVIQGELKAAELGFLMRATALVSGGASLRPVLPTLCPLSHPDHISLHCCADLPPDPTASVWMSQAAQMCFRWASGVFCSQEMCSSSSAP